MLAHDTLLLASGNAESRHNIRATFSDSFNILESSNFEQTMLLLTQNHSCIASVILDVTTPEKLDISILNTIAADPVLSTTPIIVMTPPQQPEAVSNALLMGAIEAMPSDTEPFVLRHRVDNIVDLHRHKWNLEEMVKEQAAVLRHSNDAMVDVLTSIIEYRSVESGQHNLRIRRFTQILLEEIARSAPRYRLTEESIRLISSASALHDIGKISIPDAILNKPGKLTEEEWDVMKNHTVIGSQIIETLSDIGDHEYLRYAYNICRHHHERWDGNGYPDALAGDHIPICAQVVGLADTYDALTTQRVYKDAISPRQSANMIVGGECGVFSPLLLECFKQVTGKFAEVAAAYADGHSPKADNFDTQLPGPSQLEELDALNTMRAKYQMLLHYLDAAAVEVDNAQGIYHVIYNPDPNLSILRGSTSLSLLDELVIDQARTADEKAHIRSLVTEHIPRFMEEGLMRLEHQVPIYPVGSETPIHYNLIILRQSLSNRDDQKILVIWQRANREQRRKLSPITDAGLRQQLVLLSCRNDRHLTLVGHTTAIQNVAGYDAQQLQELFNNRLMSLIVPEDQERVLKELSQKILLGGKIELEFRLRRSDGDLVWVLYQCHLESPKGQPEYFTGIILDISSTKQQEDTLRKQLEQYQIILSQTENVLYEWNLAEDTLTFSDSWEKIFGYPPVDRSLFRLLESGSHFHPEDIAAVRESMSAMQGGDDYQVMEVRIAKADGRYLWCRFRSTGLRNEAGEIYKILGIIINIDDEKRSTQALQEKAERDSLTKLLNKHAARQYAEKYLASAASNRRCALFIIDLDNFKQINDRYGHLFGDAVLTQVAKDIKRLFRAQDIVARIGGDEFLVVMRGICDRKIVESRCAQLLGSFRNLMLAHLHDSPLSCSIGVSLYPQHANSYSDLFQRADQALYRAKDMGKNNFAIYDSNDSFYYSRRKLDTAINERIDSDDQQSIAGGNLVNYAFRHLYQSTDLDATIQEILALVGQQINVSRVYIFENSEDNRFCSNTFEWCNEGILPEIHNLQNVSYEEDIPTYINHFDEQGIIYCPDINQLPDDLYQILAPQNIKSILHCAIMDGGVMRGYIGFDECLVNRYWTQEQVNTLAFFAEMLSVFLLKKRAQDDNKRLQTLLESK